MGITYQKAVKVQIKGQTAGSDKTTDTATKSDTTSTWFCNFSKGTAKAKAATKDPSETERTTLGKDKTRIDIYTVSKVELISKSKSVTSQLYGVKKGVVIDFDNQGWIKIEAFVEGKCNVGSRKKNIRVIE